MGDPVARLSASLVPSLEQTGAAFMQRLCGVQTQMNPEDLMLLFGVAVVFVGLAILWWTMEQ